MTRIRVSLLSLFLFSQFILLHGQKNVQMFRDSLDQAFDVSQWLSQAYGFFPVNSIITEPALEFGAAGGLLFINRKYDDSGKPKKVPPDIIMLGGLYTLSQSWSVGGGYKGYWMEDRIRYQGAIGYGDFNLNYYRTGFLGNERVFAMNLAGFGLVQQLSYRPFRIPLFVGFKYSYAKTIAGFEENILTIPGVDPLKLETGSGGLGPLIIFDSRDNTFSPDKGLRAELASQFYNPNFGGQSEYLRVNALGLFYFPLSSSIYGGIRLDARYVTSDVPFYSIPFVDLRGVPTLRYQGNMVFVIETEERWDFTKRWSIVGFAGLGKGVLAENNFTDSATAWNAGLGFRYLFARAYKLRGGIDLARGPENWALYITFGSSWGRL